MIIEALHIPDVYRIELQPRGDHRGVFTRLFCADELAPLMQEKKIVQINHSLTRRLHAVRGLHFQHPPYAEAKIVRCLKGKIWDVAVDIRKDSPAFLQYVAIELSGDGPFALYIPEGFAHGFQALSEDAEVLYFHTAPYNPQHEGGLHYLDPQLHIPWPFAATDISDKDHNRPFIDRTFTGI